MDMAGTPGMYSNMNMIRKLYDQPYMNFGGRAWVRVLDENMLFSYFRSLFKAPTRRQGPGPGPTQRSFGAQALVPSFKM